MPHTTCSLIIYSPVYCLRSDSWLPLYFRRVFRFTCSAFYFSFLLSFVLLTDIISSGYFLVIFCLFYFEGWGVAVSRKAFVFPRKGLRSMVHPCEVPFRCVCHCIVWNQCCREKAILALPWNWVGFMFGCRVKIKKIKVSFTTLYWKLGHSLPFLGFEFAGQHWYNAYLFDQDFLIPHF